MPFDTRNPPPDPLRILCPPRAGRVGRPLRPRPARPLATVALAVIVLLSAAGAGRTGVTTAPPMRNMELLGHVDDDPPATGPYGYSACWGYVHPDGREYAAIGTYQGTAIYALDTPTTPRRVGFIPGPFSAWREIKQYRSWLYIVTEGSDAGEGLQIVAMADPEHPRLATTRGGPFVRSHTVSVDTTRALLVCNGTRDSAGAQTGMHILSLADPEAPAELARWPAGSAAVPDSEYIHDCVMVGTRLFASSIYAGRVRVFDIADAAQPRQLRQWTYPGAFTHSAWADSTHDVLYVADERIGEPLKVFDVGDLAAPALENVLTCNPGAIVHNPRVLGHELYLANYTEGVRVLDSSDPRHPAEFAYLDTYPGSSGDFSGVWETFPYLPSGLVVASDRNSGLWVMRPVRDYALVRLELTDRSAVPLARAGGAFHAAPGAPGLAGAHVYRDGGADSLVTPGDGVVVWALDPGPHALRVRRFGYRDTTLDVTVAAGERDTFALALTPRPLGAYRGVVFDAATGAPLEDAEVAFAYTTLLGPTDVTGAFDLGPVPSDLYRIEAHAPGYVPQAVTRDVPADSSFAEFDLPPARVRDDCEQPTSWSVGAAGDDATAGIWVRVTPVGTYTLSAGVGSLLGRTWDRVAQPVHEGHGAELDPLAGPAQPGLDRTPGAGTRCWVTGQGADPSQVDEADVDGGHTTLVTPPLGCAAFADPTIGFWRWFYTNTPADPEDFLRVDISDDGTNWITVETITGLHNRWIEDAVRVRDFIATPSNAVRMRFVAADSGNRSIVEAAVDELTVYDTPVAAVPTGAPEHMRGAFALRAPAPNPSRGTMTFAIELPAPGVLEADVYDLAGRRVRVLARGPAGGGVRVLEWDGRDEHGAEAAPGLYFARVRFGAEVRVARLVRIR